MTAAATAYDGGMPAVEEVKLGLISDTHGKVAACRTALAELEAMGATAFVHCGDVCGEAVLDELAGRRVWFVWGNNDVDRKRETRYAESLGLTCLGDFGRFTFGGKTIAVTHGDDPRRVARLCDEAEKGGAGGGDDYLLSGHTHVPHDRRFGKMRWINPGALHRARPRTFALLDVAGDELTLRELDEAR